MLQHLIKLMFNRKRANVLVMSEVAVTFMVIFALISMSWHYFQAYQLPLGYKVDNTWTVWFSPGERWDNERHREQVNQMVDVLRQQPQISSAELSDGGILVNSQWLSTQDFNGIGLIFEAMRVSDNALNSWGVKLSAGRWFSAIDDNQNYQPVIVNQLFVDSFLQGLEPVNLTIPPPGDSTALPKRIVGVVEHFRQRGDFQQPVPFMFHRYDVQKGNDHGVSFLHLTFHQDMSGAYEQQLRMQLRKIAPNWQFSIYQWDSLREEQNNEVMMPMIILAIVVGFLMLMVAMGLFGILWQNINQRTSEIGLRRAMGASQWSIMTQIVGEAVVLSMFAMLAASVLLLQVPLLGLLEVMSWQNFFVSLFASMTVIVFIVILCALYPGKVAVSKTPAVALHYE